LPAAKCLRLKHRSRVPRRMQGKMAKADANARPVLV
jgi:hypothetical protein